MFDRLRRIFSYKGDLAAPPPALLEALGASWSTSAVSPEAALRVPAVAAAVRVISEAVATLPVRVCRVGSDGHHEPAPDHPASVLLSRAWNPWTSAFEGLRDATRDALTCDKGALVLANKLDGAPRELLVLRPGAWSLDRDLATGEPRYTVTMADGGTRTLALDDVAHVSAYGTLDRCPLSLAREAISVAMQLEAHAEKLFRRGARPSGLLRFKRRLDDATYARLKKSWTSNHSGDAAGGTAILEEDGDFTPLTFSSVDAQFQEARAFQVVEIARAFKLPVHMLQDMSRATWSNVSHQSREFLAYTLSPWLRSWESALTRALLTPDERAEYVISFDDDDLTQADIGERATAYSSLISARVLSPNEARAWEGLPAYQGGDTFANPAITPGTAAEPAPGDAEQPPEPEGKSARRRRDGGEDSPGRSDFNEADHRRDAAGRFADKPDGPDDAVRAAAERAGVPSAAKQASADLAEVDAAREKLDAAGRHAMDLHGRVERVLGNPNPADGFDREYSDFVVRLDEHLDRRFGEPNMAELRDVARALGRAKVKDPLGTINQTIKEMRRGGDLSDAQLGELENYRERLKTAYRNVSERATALGTSVTRLGRSLREMRRRMDRVDFDDDAALQRWSDMAEDFDPFDDDVAKLRRVTARLAR